MKKDFGQMIRDGKRDREESEAQTCATLPTYHPVNCTLRLYRAPFDSAEGTRLAEILDAHLEVLLTLELVLFEREREIHVVFLLREQRLALT